MIANADLDSCDIAVEIVGINTTGQIVNMNGQGLPGVCGIKLDDDSNAYLQATNIHLSMYTTNGIRVGRGCHALLSNIWIDEWNKSGSGFPGVEASDPTARVYLGKPFFFGQGHGGREWGGIGGFDVDA